ncbi:MAG: FimV/HubP family polar landmark protein [Cardiobacteriaceae bacterium]|nr:FimV/HubP family polar landmark protein [Cardiobacteriaceae bacterium]
MKKKNHTTKLRYAIALAVGLGVNQLALAVGLGPIQVSSYLGQPLNATIRIDGLTPQTAERTVVRLAGADAYRARGVQWQDSHKLLNFQVQPSRDGYVIKVSTQGEIRESFLNFLVTLNGEGGVITREYSLFLEPNPSGGMSATAMPAQSASPAPQTQSAQQEASKSRASVVNDGTAVVVQLQPNQAQPVASTEAVAVPVRGRQNQAVANRAVATQTQSRPVSSEHYPPPANPAALAAARTPAERAAALVSRPVDGVYGPVKPGETLYSIANALRPQDVTVQQMVNAIYNTNRSAFSGRSHSSLMVGAMLNIPEVAPNGTVKRGTRQPQSASELKPVVTQEEGRSHIIAQEASKKERKKELKPVVKTEVAPAPVLSGERGTVTVYRGSKEHGAVVQVVLPDEMSTVAPVTETIADLTQGSSSPASESSPVEVSSEEAPAETVAVEVSVSETPAAEEVVTETSPAESVAAEEEKPQGAVQVTIETPNQEGSAVLSIVETKPAETSGTVNATPSADVSSTSSALQLDSVNSIEATPAEEAKPVEEKPVEASPAEPAPAPVAEEKPAEPAPAESTPAPVAEEKPAEPAPTESPKPTTPPAPVEEVVVEEGLPLPLIAGGLGLGTLVLGGLGWFLWNRRRAKPYEDGDIIENISPEELAELERSLGADFGDGLVKEEGFDESALSFDKLKEQLGEESALEENRITHEFGDLTPHSAKDEQDEDFMDQMLGDSIEGDDGFFEASTSQETDFLDSDDESLSSHDAYMEPIDLFGGIDDDVEENDEIALDFSQSAHQSASSDTSFVAHEEPSVKIDDEWNFDEISLGEPELANVSFDESPVDVVDFSPSSALVTPVEDESFIEIEDSTQNLSFSTFIDTNSHDPFIDTDALEVTTEQNDDMFISFNTGTVQLDEPVVEQSAFVEHDADDGMVLNFSDEDSMLTSTTHQPVEDVFVDDSALSGGLSLSHSDFFEASTEPAESALLREDLFASSESAMSLTDDSEAESHIFVADSLAETAPVEVAPVEVAKPAAKVEVMEQDMSINLELAHSFIATGRPERARTWLEEVVALGTEEQKAEAARLLQQIG